MIELITLVLVTIALLIVAVENREDKLLRGIFAFFCLVGAVLIILTVIGGVG